MKPTVQEKLARIRAEIVKCLDQKAGTHQEVMRELLRRERILEMSLKKAVKR